MSEIINEIFGGQGSGSGGAILQWDPVLEPNKVVSGKRGGGTYVIVNNATITSIDNVPAGTGKNTIIYFNEDIEKWEICSASDSQQTYKGTFTTPAILESTYPAANQNIGSTADVLSTGTKWFVNTFNVWVDSGGSGDLSSLKIANFLSEFNTPTAKSAAAQNIDVYQKATTDTLLDTKITKIINPVANQIPLMDANGSLLKSNKLLSDFEPVITTKNSAFNKNYGTDQSKLKQNGVAAVGAEDSLARLDHIHPSDTAKADLTYVNTQLASKANTTDVNTALNLKVDKVLGKQLSTEDYTTAEKNKLAGISAGAEVNVNADWNATSGDAQILNKPTLATASAKDVGSAIGQLQENGSTLGLSQTVETDANGKFKTAAKATGYNLPLGNVSGSVVEGGTVYLKGEVDTLIVGAKDLGNATGTLEIAKVEGLQGQLNAKELASNKSIDINLGTSDVLYPSQKAVKNYVDNSLQNTEDKFEIGRRIAKLYSSELYDVTAYLKGLTYANVSTEAQLLAAILVEGFVIKLTNNITVASQINFAQKGVLHLNGFTINASVPTVVVNITKAVIISGGTLSHEKLTDTAVEVLVKINTPVNERAILHSLTLKHVEFGVDLSGSWALQNVNFEYNTLFGTATDSHRHIAIKTVLGDCFIDSITFSGIPQVATTRYTNFILADITEWTGNLHIRNVKQSAVGALRQFLNFQTLGVNVTAGKLIIQDCNFNDLNGGIFFLTAGALDKMEYIVLTNNEQGGDAIGGFKGLLYFSFAGALGTKAKIIHYNNKTLAGALRVDYVSLIPTADTTNTGIVARQNTVTINAGQEYAVANKSIVDTFHQDFYRKGENDVALNTKQNITDNTLNTTSKTIVGGINELKTSIDGKVDKVTGKGLSTEDFTTAEKTKLAGVEAGATADQTASEIKAAYESNDNTNVFTDAEKTKIGYISVTQVVDLDTMESDIVANNAKVSNATHTGDVTGATALTIANNAVTKAKIQQIATKKVLGRTTAGTGDVEEVDIATTLKADLSLNNVTNNAQLAIASNLADLNNRQTALNNITDASSTVQYAFLSKDVSNNITFSSNIPALSSRPILASNQRLAFWNTTTSLHEYWDGTTWYSLAPSSPPTASTVTFTPAGNISSTNVQSAIQELDSEKEPTFTKNTAFNKNFGTTSGTTSEGNDARFPVKRLSVYIGNNIVSNKKGVSFSYGATISSPFLTLSMVTGSNNDSLTVKAINITTTGAYLEVYRTDGAIWGDTEVFCNVVVYSGTY